MVELADSILWLYTTTRYFLTPNFTALFSVLSSFTFYYAEERSQGSWYFSQVLIVSLKLNGQDNICHIGSAV